MKPKSGRINHNAQVSAAIDIKDCQVNLTKGCLKNETALIIFDHYVYGQWSQSLNFTHDFLKNKDYAETRRGHSLQGTCPASDGQDMFILRLLLWVVWFIMRMGRTFL